MTRRREFRPYRARVSSSVTLFSNDHLDLWVSLCLSRRVVAFDLPNMGLMHGIVTRTSSVITDRGEEGIDITISLCLPRPGDEVVSMGSLKNFDLDHRIV